MSMSYFQKDLLKDKVIIVTGGGTGLGKAMTRGFLELGGKVVIASRKAEVIDATVAELSEYAGSLHGLPVDVTDVSDVDQLFKETIASYGKVDALVNNAAVNIISPTEKLSHPVFRIVVDTVLMGTIYCTMEAGKYWIKNNLPGNVLNILTGYSADGTGYAVPSATAKAGVHVLTKSLASEWGKYNIRLNGIAPGPFPTEGAFSRILPSDEMQEHVINRIPMKRFGKPFELADLASFLISDVSSYISGEVIRIDGAMHANLAGEMNFLDKYILGENWKSF